MWNSWCSQGHRAIVFHSPRNRNQCERKTYDHPTDTRSILWREAMNQPSYPKIRRDKLQWFPWADSSFIGLLGSDLWCSSQQIPNFHHRTRLRGAQILGWILFSAGWLEARISCQHGFNDFSLVHKEILLVTASPHVAWTLDCTTIGLSTRCMAFIFGHRTNESDSNNSHDAHIDRTSLCVHTNTRSERVRASNNMRPHNHWHLVSSLEVNNTSLMPPILTANLRPRTHPVPCCTSSLQGPRHAGSDLAHLPKSITGSRATNTEKDDAGHSTADWKKKTTTRSSETANDELWQKMMRHIRFAGSVFCFPTAPSQQFCKHSFGPSHRACAGGRSCKRSQSPDSSPTNTRDTTWGEVEVVARAKGKMCKKKTRKNSRENSRAEKNRHLSLCPWWPPSPFARCCRTCCPWWAGAGKRCWISRDAWLWTRSSQASSSWSRRARCPQRWRASDEKNAIGIGSHHKPAAHTRPAHTRPRRAVCSLNPSSASHHPHSSTRVRPKSSPPSVAFRNAKMRIP